MSLKDGFYKCRATGRMTIGEAANGTEGMAFEVDILDDDGAPIARKETWLYFTGKTVEMNSERLRAIGVVGDDLSVDPIPGLGSVVARCELKTETYEGKSRQKVEIKTSNGAAFKSEMTPEKRRMFAAKMKQHLARVPIAEGASASYVPPTSHAASGGNGSERFDDIPF